jgi:PAS domain S-box-containing protein
MTSTPVSALHSQRFDKVLEHVNVPSYVLDVGGVVRWLNKAARQLVGEVQGRQFTSVVAPEDSRKARDLFARKILNTSSVTDGAFVVVDPGGKRVSVEVSSVPLFDGEHVVGVFGQVSDIVEEPHPHPQLPLTPRQAEILDLLERGRSTSQIAEDLHLSIQTVRNHVQNLMRAIGAHSRLEAVAIANRAH